MATPVGANTVTAIARRRLMPYVTDNTYNSNVLLFRWVRAQKRLVQGGYQIEFPLMYKTWANGGVYQGYDLLDTSPSDTVQNGAWDWKQQYVIVTVDGLTLGKVDTPEAIANYLTLQFAQAEMQLAENLATGIMSSSADSSKQISGIDGALDDGVIGGISPYGGLTRSASTNAWWRCTNIDTTVYSGGTLTLALLQKQWGNAQQGGRHPTVIVSQQPGYNTYWAMNTSIQRYPVPEVAVSEQLMQAGWSNLLFNGAPWLIDSHVPQGTNGAGSTKVFMINEEYIWWIVNRRVDIWMEDFITPPNQDAMSAKILWMGNLIFTNCARHAKFQSVQP